MSKFSPPQSFPMEFSDQATSFDPEAFDELIHYQGVTLVHYSALPCPVGMIDPDDIRKPHEDHSDCSNGFLYSCEGEITCSFLGGNKDTRNYDLGRLDDSNVQVTFPRYYDKSERPVSACPFDRIYLKDEAITVPTWERFSTKPGKLINKLRYPAVCVQYLMDATGKKYTQGIDFTVVGGKIQWNQASLPGYDPVTQKGTVCAVRYTYRPYYYIQRMPHEVRVAQTEDGDGNRQVMRFPQMAILVREHFFENEQRQEGTTSPRDIPEPSGSDISFGSR